MDYEGFFKQCLGTPHAEDCDRVFADLERRCEALSARLLPPHRLSQLPSVSGEKRRECRADRGA
jgi:hypothetical protein